MAGKTRQLTRRNLGFLLAKASQRWNELLYEACCREGYPQVRPAYGSILIPLFEEDGLRLGELARRAGLSKQTMTTMVRAMEESGLVLRRPDPEDARAARVYLTPRARRFQPAAEAILENLEVMAGRLASGADLERMRDWLERMAKAGG